MLFQILKFCTIFIENGWIVGAEVNLLIRSRIESFVQEMKNSNINIQPQS